ncbi:hypothetical protein L1049_007686 [Liquidambar formosana]|uniref:EF-hand domain-containing protein n=1 Tax=Liquidambar formosana TaxID=63359 RepID=A0AAP0S8P3_LIQFO
MEVAAGTTTTVCNRTLTKKTSSSSSSSSFRLRCPSLNSLRLRRIFDLFDKNGDGIITVDELSRALNLLGLDADLSDLHSIVNSYVKPGLDGLKFEDFEALHRSLNDTYFGYEDEEGEDGKSASASGGGALARVAQEESDLSEAFKVFDEDGDGYISAKELQVVLGKLGLAEGREIARVQQMIISVDRNHDGRVDFFEFKDMMRRSVLVHTS